MPMSAGSLSLAMVGAIAGLSLAAAQAPVCDNVHYPSELLLKVGIDSAPGFDLKPDGLGDYSDGAVECIVARQKFTGMPLLGFPAETTHGCSDTSPSRHFSFNLTHPVDGAPSRGVVTVDEGSLVFVPAIGAAGYVGLTDLVIGASTKAQLFEILNRDTGDHFVFAPRWVKGCDARHVPGPLAGTTEADLIRTSATTWEITLPAGSVGRLYTIDKNHVVVEKGRYSFQGHVSIRAR